MQRIPDCYDPAVQEEQRQAEWDKLLEILPVCTLCRKRLFPGEKFHTASYMVVCAECLEELEENEDIVEVD